jgi:hypothetical protein
MIVAFLFGDQAASSGWQVSYRCSSLTSIASQNVILMAFLCRLAVSTDEG